MLSSPISSAPVGLDNCPKQITKGATIAVLFLLLFLISRVWFASRWPRRLGRRNELALIPRKYSLVPGILHVALFWFKGPQYLSRMVPAPDYPICYVKIFGRKVVIAHHSLDYDLARHSREISLPHYAASTLTKYVIQLDDQARNGIMHLDSKFMFHDAFAKKDSLSTLAAGSYRCIENEILKIENEEVCLSRWLFRFSARAVAHSLWHEGSPWTASSQTLNDLMLFGETFQTLYFPFPRLTASTAYAARKRLVKTLMKYYMERKIGAETTIPHHLNIVRMHDEHWHENPSYYGVEILIAITLLSSIGNTVAFMFRHILTESSVCTKIQKEVELMQTEDAVVDIARLSETCPLLIASWYEVLRLHATLVPRQATKSFDLGGKWEIGAGDIIMLPMTASNLDPMIWGSNCNDFVPSRFLNIDGSLNDRLTRKVKGFGVAGNLCPGRFFGFTTAMAVVIGLLLTVDLQSKSGVWPAPQAADGFTAGIERYGDDVRALLTKKKRAGNRKLRISNSVIFSRY